MGEGEESAEELLKVFRAMVGAGRGESGGPAPLRLGQEARIDAPAGGDFSTGPPLSEELSAAALFPGEAGLRETVRQMVGEEIEGRQLDALENRIRQIVRQELAAMFPSAGDPGAGPED